MVEGEYNKNSKADNTSEWDNGSSGDGSSGLSSQYMDELFSGFKTKDQESGGAIASDSSTRESQAQGERSRADAEAGRTGLAIEGERGFDKKPGLEVYKPSLLWENNRDKAGNLMQDDASLDKYASAIVDAMNNKSIDTVLRSLANNSHDFSPERLRALIDRVNQTMGNANSNMRLDLTQSVTTTSWRPGTPGVAIHTNRIDFRRGGATERSFESAPAYESLGSSKR